MSGASANNVPESNMIPETAPKQTVAKIGVVDVMRIIETSYQGKAAQSQIKKQKYKMEKDLKEKGAEIELIRQQLEREGMVMSKEAREEKERQARIKLMHFKALVKMYRQELQS